MPRVNWEQVPQPVYDDMVSVLLSLEHRDAERIDGTGGDGGRDVQLREDGLLDIFELKSFNGRLSARRPNRRQQVERSLANAAEHKPDSWSLVVPIDHNPDELAWFDRLRARYPFPLHWLGKTWLDGKMAKYPELVRYFLYDGDNEAMAALRELQREQAVLAGGAPEALERFQRLSERLDEVSPHYRLDLAREGQGYRVTVVPRYRGAEHDRPILVGGQFTFPDSDAGREVRERVADVFNYGGEVEVSEEYVGHLEIDAPAGLGGTFRGAKIKLSSHSVTDNLPLDARLILLDPSDRPLVSLPIRLDDRVLGQRGATLSGQDVTGGLRVRIRVDIDRRGRLNFQLSQPPGVLPAVVLPLLRFALRMRAPNRLQVRFGHHELCEPMPLPDAELASEGMVNLVEDLEFIQARTNTPFAMPETFTREDLSTIHQTVRLLAGERVVIGSGPMEVTMTVTEPSALAELLTREEASALVYTTDAATATIAGVEVPLGSATTYVRAAILDSRQQLQALGEVEAGTTLAVRFLPVDDAPIEMTLQRYVNDDGTI